MSLVPARTLTLIDLKDQHGTCILYASTAHTGKLSLALAKRDEGLELKT